MGLYTEIVAGEVMVGLEKFDLLGKNHKFKFNLIKEKKSISNSIDYLTNDQEDKVYSLYPVTNKLTNNNNNTLDISLTGATDLVDSPNMNNKDNTILNVTDPYEIEDIENVNPVINNNQSINNQSINYPVINNNNQSINNQSINNQSINNQSIDNIIPEYETFINMKDKIKIVKDKMNESKKKNLLFDNRCDDKFIKDNYYDKNNIPCEGCLF